MKATLTKPLKAVAGTIIYLVVLLFIYVIHMRFFEVDVVFYSVLFDVVVATTLSTVFLAIFGCFSGFNPFERLLLSVVWLLLGYSYAISVPTVIDRSLSFYMLEKIQQRGGGIRQDRFEDIFTRGYAREHQLVAVRLTEQLASGTVTISDGCVRLTGRGERLARFSRLFRRYLLPRHRLLMGSYTDELTQPFQQVPNAAGDSCR